MLAANNLELCGYHLVTPTKTPAEINATFAGRRRRPLSAAAYYSACHLRLI
jgi:hypothetical protein